MGLVDQIQDSLCAPSASQTPCAFGASVVDKSAAFRSLTRAYPVFQLGKRFCFQAWAGSTPKRVDVPKLEISEAIKKDRALTLPRMAYKSRPAVQQTSSSCMGQNPLLGGYF